MRCRAALLAVFPLLGAAIVAASGAAFAATTLWPTYHLDPGRSGNDTNEPSFNSLSTAWTSAALDGALYAEPLVDGNLVIVATENNSLYAFNATTGSPVWGPINPFGPARTTFPSPCGNIMPLGITSTPVIDGGFLYAVGDVQITSTTFQWHLAKVNPTTGAVSYTTDITPPPGGRSTMDTNLQQERAALAVSNGNIVVTWGGLSNDCGDYHGFVVTASESTGTVQAQWNDTYETSTSKGGGIWGTSGPAVDSSGNIYVNTGNGSSTTITAYTGDYGDSVLKLSPSLSLLSFFAPGPPESWVNSNTFDVDLGSTGPSLLPNGLLFAIGKGGLGYLLNQSALPDNSNPGGGENFSAQVCHATQDAAYGGLAVSGSVVFVPCSDGLAAINIDSSTAFHRIWYSSSGGASPIVAGGLVWTMKTFGGTTLYGLQPGTGALAATLTLPATTEHFATPAAGDGMLFVGAGNKVVAFRPPVCVSTSVPLVGAYQGGTNPQVGLAGVNSDSSCVMAGGASGLQASAAWLTVPFYGSRATLSGDVTGDGATDLVAVNDGSTWVASSNGTNRFNAPAGWSSTPFYGSVATLLADVNHDGKADLVAINNSSTWVMLSTGTGFGLPQLWSSTPFYGSKATLAADVNGDGSADLVAVNNSSTWVMLSNGTNGFAKPVLWSSTPFYGSRATLAADVNGDGKADLIAVNDSSVWVMISTGTSFPAPASWSSALFYGSQVTLAGDLNGDGTADLIAVNGTNVYAILSNGSTAFGAPQLWATSSV